MEATISTIYQNPASGPTPTSADPARDARPVDAFVVPMPDRAATFFDADLTALDPNGGLFRLDVYSPYPLSDGELAYLQTEFEAEMVAYARRVSATDRSWRWAAAIGLLDLIVLAGLLLFAVVNADRSFLIFAWAFAVALLPGPFIAIILFSHRRRTARACRLLQASFVSAGIGQGGAGSSYIKAIWEAVEHSSGDRDILTLERLCRINNWAAGLRFYRSRRGGRSRAHPHRRPGLLRALLGRRRPRYASSVLSRGL